MNKYQILGYIESHGSWLTDSSSMNFSHWMSRVSIVRIDGKGDSASAPSRFSSLSEREVPQILTERHFGETKQIQTALFQPLKVSLNLTVLRVLNIKLELSAENLNWIKPIPILLNISLTANNHFWYCCSFSASNLMHNSTGYVIKQLVHAFTCF